MNILNKTEVALYCVSGLIQYASSTESMLNIYNENGKLYEIRKDKNGNDILWHKGHKLIVGTFKESNADERLRDMAYEVCK